MQRDQRNNSIQEAKHLKQKDREKKRIKSQFLYFQEILRGEYNLNALTVNMLNRNCKNIKQENDMKQSWFGLSVGKAELGEGIPNPDFARADSPFNVVSGYLEALFTLKERWKSKNKCVCEREKKKKKKQR